MNKTFSTNMNGEEFSQKMIEQEQSIFISFNDNEYGNIDNETNIVIIEGK